MHHHCRPFFPLIAACGPFERAPTLAVAVSGGADSMALLLLAQDWAKSNGGRAVALTVDHGLRKESAGEAQQVRKWCEARGIEHIIFPPPVWEEVKVMQDTAREARYRLLADWCKSHHVLHLLAAHHQDDQAETLFFRLGRGSGLDGLACMPMVSQVHGIRLLRPLLSTQKSTLKTLLMAAGQPWIEDPSNRNPKYTRNRIRAGMNDSENPALLSEKTGELVQRFATIRNHNDRRLAAKLPGIISIFPDHAYLHMEPFLALPQADGMRALAALTMALSGLGTPPRTEKLQLLYNELPAFRRQRSFGNLMFIRQKHGRLLVKRLENAAGAPHILPMRRPVKALAGAPFFVMNNIPATHQGARALHA